MAFNSSKKLSDNMEALRLAFAGQENYNHEETAILSSYAGFGGLKAVLFGAGDTESWVRQNASANDLRLYPLVKELHELLQAYLSTAGYKSAIGAMKSSILTAFYTPDVVPNALYAAMVEQEIVPMKLYQRSGKSISSFTGHQCGRKGCADRKSADRTCQNVSGPGQCSG